MPRFQHCRKRNSTDDFTSSFEQTQEVLLLSQSAMVSRNTQLAFILILYLPDENSALHIDSNYLVWFQQPYKAMAKADSAVRKQLYVDLLEQATAFPYA